MNSRRQFYCQMPTMSGLRFVFMALSLLRTIIMLFIRSAPNCDFVRRNHQRRTRLKRHFELCSLLIGSYNINNGPRTTNTMLTSFVTYSRLRNMMNLLLRIITNVVLGPLLPLRFIIMRRKQVLLRIQIQRRMVGLQGPAAIGRRIESYQR
jgi:CBS domain containing-hemolysin-like protein